MNTKRLKKYRAPKEVVKRPDFDIPSARELHPKPCTNEDFFWHGRLDMANVPSLAEERWRIVDEGDRWTLWFIPPNHPKRWRELGNFSTETEAIEYVKCL